LRKSHTEKGLFYKKKLCAHKYRTAVGGVVELGCPAAQGWRQGVQHMHDPNSIIDAHSASPRVHVPVHVPEYHRICTETRQN